MISGFNCFIWVIFRTLLRSRKFHPTVILLGSDVCLAAIVLR